MYCKACGTRILIQMRLPIPGQDQSDLITDYETGKVHICTGAPDVAVKNNVTTQIKKKRENKVASIC